MVWGVYTVLSGTAGGRLAAGYVRDLVTVSGHAGWVASRRSVIFSFLGLYRLFHKHLQLYK